MNFTLKDKLFSYLVAHDSWKSPGWRSLFSPGRHSEVVVEKSSLTIFCFCCSDFKWQGDKCSQRENTKYLTKSQKKQNFINAYHVSSTSA